MANGAASAASTPTLTRGSVGTTFLTAPYRPNDSASASPMTGGAPTSTVSTTTAITAMARATICTRLSRSRKMSTPSATLINGLMK